MPLIRVEMFPGRNQEQKSDLVAEVTDAFLRTCGGTAETVQVIVQEVHSSSWAVAGKMISDSQHS
jgi:4-oxalocrotonate tautomerase